MSQSDTVKLRKESRQECRNEKINDCEKLTFSFKMNYTNDNEIGVNRKSENSNNSDTESVYMVMDRRKSFIDPDHRVSENYNKSVYMVMDRKRSNSEHDLRVSENYNKSVYLVMDRKRSNSKHDLIYPSSTMYLTMYLESSEIPNENDNEQYKISTMIEKHIHTNYDVPEYNINVTPIKERRNFSNNFGSNIDTCQFANIFYCFQLKEEILHSGGVEINIKKSNLKGMRIVSKNNNIWISKSPRRKELNTYFHVGDRIISVDSENVMNINDVADKIIKKAEFAKIKIILQRLYHGKVFLVKAKDFESVLHYNTLYGGYLLKEDMDNINKRDVWIITEIDGRNVEIINNQKDIKRTMNKDPEQYILIVMHNKYFINEYLRLDLTSL